MKYILSLLCILVSMMGLSQQDSINYGAKSHPTYARRSITASVSIGFLDDYKQNYSLPLGFQKSNTSGFAPVYARVEYALYKHVSLAAMFSYDAFYYNYRQEFTGNNGSFTRNKINKTKVFSGGVSAYYHLNHVFHSRHIDPFIGAGLSLNNVSYSAYPQGDSTITHKDHNVSPYLKLGARYYITDKFSIFGDVGYDKQSIFSVGFSCRFYSQKLGIK